MTVTEAILTLKSGDKSGLKFLVYRYSHDLIKVASRYTRDVEEAKDVLQDSFIQIYKFIHQLEQNDENAFGKWARRIVINMALRKKRKKYYQNENEEINQDNQPFQNPKITSKLNEEDIHSLVNELPEKYRLVFKLVAIDGFNHQEISALLKIKEGTSRSQFMRARRMLQEKLYQTTITCNER